jgi:hypothetical protein
MTEYGEERERRRKDAMALGVFMSVFLIVEPLAKIGLVPTVLGVVALVALGSGVYQLVDWRLRRAEGRGGGGGAPPSWSAQLPMVFARELGATSPRRGSRRTGNGGLLGRLVCLETGLRWEPRSADRARVVAPITWDWSWTVEIVPIRGLGDQGCLTLTRPDGFAVDLWIRHPADLRRTLQLP